MKDAVDLEQMMDDSIKKAIDEGFAVTCRRGPTTAFEGGDKIEPCGWSGAARELAKNPEHGGWTCPNGHGGNNLLFQPPDPKNGWLVLCMPLNSYTIIASRDALAHEIDRLLAEFDKRNPKNPGIGDTVLDGSLIAVYELGPRVSVRVKPIVERIKRKDGE